MSISHETKPGTGVTLASAVQNWTTDILYVIDRNGLVTDGNDRLRNELGLATPPAAVSLLDVISENEQNSARRVWQIIMSHRKSERSFRKLKTAKGDLNIYNIIESPIVSGNDVVGIVGIARDVTEEAEVEEKLWTEQENRQAALEYSVRASLGIIKGYVFSLQKLEAMPVDKRERFSRIIAEEVDTMGRNIENLLLSRGVCSTNGELTIFDLHQILSECLLSFKSESERRSIELNMVRPQTEVNFYGEPMTMCRIFSNLVDFCLLRVTHSGCIDVSIKDSDEYVEIVIQDNGPPMAATEIEWLMGASRKGESNPSAMTGSKLDFDVARLLADSLGGGILPRAGETGGLELTVMLPRTLTSSFSHQAATAEAH